MPKVKINGIELYYFTRGTGIPIMFMHGGLGADHSYFPPFFDHLADEYQLIYYDHRGNGRSPVSSLEGVTHETWADDADALREHLGHEKIILLGNSYGGFLAQEYAIRYGEHLQGLALICTSPALDYFDVIMSNAKSKTSDLDILAAVEDVFSNDPVHTDADFQNLLGRLGPLYFYDFAPYKDMLNEAFNDMIYSADAWNHSYANCWSTFNVIPYLPSVKTPTLIISGAHDWITPIAEGGQRIHDAMSNSEHVIFEKSGHYPYIEESAKFIRTLRDWLAKL